MTPEEAKGGPAKVVDWKGGEEPDFMVLVGDIQLYGSGDYADAVDHADRLNAALSPLLRRAELAERMAEVVKELIHLIDTGNTAYVATYTADKRDVSPAFEWTEKGREALKSWDAIKGDGE